jgi:hypothetical protein
MTLTRIPAPSRLYLINIETWGVGETRTLPNPIHQATYFSRVSPMSLGSESLAGSCGGGRPSRGGRAGWGGGRGGGREGRKIISYPVTRAYTHEILLFSYSLLGNEPISGSHFSSFLHILPLKQYKGRISIKV